MPANGRRDLIRRLKVKYVSRYSRILVTISHGWIRSCLTCSLLVETRHRKHYKKGVIILCSVWITELIYSPKSKEHIHSRKHRVLFLLPRQYYYLPRFSRVPLRPFSFSAPPRKIYVKRKLTGRNIPIHLVSLISFSKQQWHINGFFCVTRLGQFKSFIKL